MEGGAWKAAVHGVAKGWTRLSDFTFTFLFHALEKEMATHCSVLAWRIPGTGEPGGLPSVGSHRVGHDWSDLAAAAERLSLFVCKALKLHAGHDQEGFDPCPSRSYLLMGQKMKQVKILWQSLHSVSLELWECPNLLDNVTASCYLAVRGRRFFFPHWLL